MANRGLIVCYVPRLMMVMMSLIELMMSYDPDVGVKCKVSFHVGDLCMHISEICVVLCVNHVELFSKRTGKRPCFGPFPKI